MKNYAPNNFKIQYALGQMHGNKGTKLFRFSNKVSMIFLTFLTITSVKAQTVSGAWDAAATNGTTGYNNYGSGVIQLLSTASTGCAGAAVHETSSTYDPTSGTPFSKCYKVYFGCPGNDNIGSDVNGDGLAFSFWKHSTTYNINNGLACGGGLGYMGSASDGKMITIEFDTWSSQCLNNFDCTYGGGTSGDHDEIALQKNGDASDAGKITAIDAGNLEDGLEHDVCITYNPSNHKLSVSLDGTTVFAYDLTGSSYDLPTYFGSGGLNQTWSSGKYGATNPATVSDGAGIASTIGAPLCPAGVVITSPDNGATYGGCSVGPINITATATPPAGNTVSYVEFFIDGVSIGTDNTATSSYNYGISWNSPSVGSHTISAVAHYTPSNTSSTSSSVSVTVGGDIELTSTSPTIDGTAESLWNSYTSLSLTQGYNSSPDLAGSYKIMYDATNLYVLVNVTDDILVNNGGSAWNNDGVEIFIDIGNTKTTSYGSNQFQYDFNYNSSTVTEYKHNATSGVTFGQTHPGGGYVMEIKFPWSTLGASAPVVGSYIGFDVSIDDDDTGNRDNQLSWHDGTFGEWNNPSLFGTLQFSSCNPLPVKIISLTGKIENGTVVLDWTTISEVNNEKFIIERSVDLSNWEIAGEVEAKGSLTSITDYSFTDHSYEDKRLYYRLLQMDLNGTITYSNVISIETSYNNISIAPTYFEDALTIKSNVKCDLDIRIYDVLGRMLYQVNKENNNGSLTINPDLPSGAYMMVVQTQSFVEEKKIVKK